MSGKSGGSKIKIDAGLYKILSDKMRDEGWANCRQFTLGTKIPLSVETTRRAFDPCEHKGLEALTIAMIAAHLNFTSAEIAHLLKTYTTDDFLWKLIQVGGGESLTPMEACVLAACRVIMAVGPSAIAMLASQLEMVASAVGCDVSQYTGNLKKRGN